MDLQVRGGSNVSHNRLDASWHLSQSGAVCLQPYHVCGLIEEKLVKIQPRGRVLCELERHCKVCFLALIVLEVVI